MRLAWLLVVLTSGVAMAQPNKPAPKPVAKPDPGKPKEQIINIGDGLSSRGKVRNANLLYFLERANEELERASLEKRSFLPRLTRSLDDEAL